jgi:hypothetical protein
VLLSGTAVNGSSLLDDYEAELKITADFGGMGFARTLLSMMERSNLYSDGTHFNTGLYVNLTAESASSSRMLPCHTEIMLIC